MASYIELIMDQGATFNSTITLKDDVTNASINLVGYSVRSQMRRSYYSVNAAANLVCTLSDAANGVINVSLGSGNTANIRANKYLFDLETVDPNGVVSRVLEGTIIVTPEITKL